MTTPLDPKDLVTLEELTISNMWEVAALIEVLEKKGVMKKQDIWDAIRELRQKNPKARTPLELDHPSANAEPRPKKIDGNAVVERILELILESRLSSRQAREVLDRAKEAIDWGARKKRRRCQIIENVTLLLENCYIFGQSQ